MEKILKLANGKKTTVATILGAIITFSLGQGYLTAEVANLLTTILVALGFSANYANSKKQ
jgi:hypothetical protein